jgi:ParB family chromosome partitioning protein
VNSKKDQPFNLKLRGVAALLGDVEDSSSTPPYTLPLRQITPCNQQPRTYFSPEKQKQLVNSIRDKGVLEPILVRPISVNHYQIVAGERRYRAALEIGLEEIPVVIKNFTDEEALQVSLIENLLRENLNPLEETEGILKLLALNLDKETAEVVSLLHRMLNESKGKVTQNVLGSSEAEKVKEIFQSLNSLSWESYVSSRLPLLNLPEDILQVLREGKIAYTKAIAIAKLDEVDTRRELLQEAIAENLSLSQIKAKIQQIKSIESEEAEELIPQQRVKLTLRKITKAKVWTNPEKRKQLESLLSQIEQLLDE